MVVTGNVTLILCVSDSMLCTGHHF